MLKNCFRSAIDFFSFILLDISLAETLLDVSNFRLENKKKKPNFVNQHFAFLLSIEEEEEKTSVTNK